VTVVVTVADSPTQFAAGIVDAVQLRLSDPLGGGPDPLAQAADLRLHLNANEQALVDHTNRVAAENNYKIGNGTYVYSLTVERMDASQTIYLVGTANGERVTGYEVVNETDREVTESFTITSTQAEALNKDIRAYNETYVSDGRVPDDGYYLAKGVKFGSAGGFL
jgi:hypothetical protein